MATLLSSASAFPVTLMMEATTASSPWSTKQPPPPPQVDEEDDSLNDNNNDNDNKRATPAAEQQQQDNPPPPALPLHGLVRSESLSSCESAWSDPAIPNLLEDSSSMMDTQFMVSRQRQGDDVDDDDDDDSHLFDPDEDDDEEEEEIIFQHNHHRNQEGAAVSPPPPPMLFHGWTTKPETSGHHHHHQKKQHKDSATSFSSSLVTNEDDEEEEEGIAIPPVLEQLLGLSFVPFLPNNNGNSNDTQSESQPKPLQPKEVSTTTVRSNRWWQGDNKTKNTPLPDLKDPTTNRTSLDSPKVQSEQVATSQRKEKEEQSTLPKIQDDEEKVSLPPISTQPSQPPPIIVPEKEAAEEEIKMTDSTPTTATTLSSSSSSSPRKPFWSFRSGNNSNHNNKKQRSAQQPQSQHQNCNNHNHNNNPNWMITTSSSSSLDHSNHSSSHCSHDATGRPRIHTLEGQDLQPCVSPTTSTSTTNTIPSGDWRRDSFAHNKRVIGDCSAPSITSMYATTTATLPTTDSMPITAEDLKRVSCASSCSGAPKHQPPVAPSQPEPLPAAPTATTPTTPLIRKLFSGRGSMMMNHHHPTGHNSGSNDLPPPPPPPLLQQQHSSLSQSSSSGRQPLLKGAIVKTIQKIKEKRKSHQQNNHNSNNNYGSSNSKDNKDSQHHDHDQNSQRNWSTGIGNGSAPPPIISEGLLLLPSPPGSSGTASTARRSRPLHPLAGSPLLPSPKLAGSSAITTTTVLHPPLTSTATGVGIGAAVASAVTRTRTRTELDALQEQAVAIQQTVTQSEQRIVQLQTQAQQLLEAFRTTSAQLQTETILLLKCRDELLLVQQQTTAVLQQQQQQAQEESSSFIQASLSNESNEDCILLECCSSDNNPAKAAATPSPSHKEKPPFLSARNRTPTFDEALFTANKQKQQRTSLPPSYPLRRASSSVAYSSSSPATAAAPLASHAPPLLTQPCSRESTLSTLSSSSPRLDLGLTTTTNTTPPSSPNRKRCNTEPISPNRQHGAGDRESDAECIGSKDETSNRQRSSSVPVTFQRSHSLIRTDGLKLDTCATIPESPHQSFLEKAFPDNRLNSKTLLSVDDHMPMVLQQLANLGLEICTDESDRFNPSWETQRIIKNKKCCRSEPTPEWPLTPWHDALHDSDVLVWTGQMPKDCGFGHDWPIVKVRGKVRTNPRTLLQFLLDSSQIKKYNKMSQGRDDVAVLQQGVDTKPEHSVHGFAGDAKVIRALNKPKLSPKTIETVCLCYAIPLDNVAPNSYLIVNRSVWEHGGNEGVAPRQGSGNNNNIIRSEMILGVQLLRPCGESDHTSGRLTRSNSGENGGDSGSCCELTTITHVFSPCVPEIMAKRMAPSSAANLMKEIQSIFAAGNK